jgi:pilus assembly protein CpaC
MIQHRSKIRFHAVIAMVWLSALVSPGLLAETETVPINKGRVMNLHQSTEHVTINVSNPDVADVLLLDSKHLYILGKRLGTTNIVFCRASSCGQTIELEVTHDLDGLKAKLHDLFPEEHPEVRSSEGAIVLSGMVSSVQKMDAILRIATTFAPRSEEQPSVSGGSAGQVGLLGGGGSSNGGRMGLLGANEGPSQHQAGSSPAAPQGQETGVINLMQVGGPEQVMLSVTVAELNRTLARSLKVDLAAIGGAGRVSAGAIGVPSNTTSTSSISDGSVLTSAVTAAASAASPYALFFRFISGDASVRTVINAARTNGLAKVLAEPNLTVISGQDADFMAGGEFPMPVPQNNSGNSTTITIQFKPYGVMLKFLPVVLNTGHISLKLNIDVSELSQANAISITSGSITYNIPSLTKRSANTSLELNDGQTLGIAGLLSDSLTEAITKFPGLGDIPILGQLFTSQSYQNSETELVIFVTPHLVKPITADKIRLPTDKFVDPSDEEFYLMGRTEGILTPTPRNRDNGQSYTGGLRGHFGQQP